jgi:hypothetical protein
LEVLDPAGLRKVFFQVFCGKPWLDLRAGNRAAALRCALSLLVVLVPNALLLRYVGIGAYLRLLAPAASLYCFLYEARRRAARACTGPSAFGRGGSA